MIGVDDKSRPFVERITRLSGLENRAIVRPGRIPPGDEFQPLVRNGPDWFDVPGYLEEKVILHFEAVAHQCIDDGAEVIVTGCALDGSLTLAGYNRVGRCWIPWQWVSSGRNAGGAVSQHRVVHQQASDLPVHGVRTDAAGIAGVFPCADRSALRCVEWPASRKTVRIPVFSSRSARAAWRTC